MANATVYPPMPAQLPKYSPDTHITNYFKLMHEKVAELNSRVTAAEIEIKLLKEGV